MLLSFVLVFLGVKDPGSSSRCPNPSLRVNKRILLLFDATCTVLYLRQRLIDMSSQAETDHNAAIAAAQLLLDLSFPLLLAHRQNAARQHHSHSQSEDDQSEM